MQKRTAITAPKGAVLQCVTLCLGHKFVFFRRVGDILILIFAFIAIYSGIESVEILANEAAVIRQELSCVDYFQVG